MARKRGSSYWHYNFACPFYDFDTRERIGCEGGIVVEMPDRRDLKQIMREYCCDVNRWEECPIAKIIVKKYEQEDDNAE